MARIILALTSSTQNRQAVLGDLEEIYYDLGARQDSRSARQWYWTQALATFPRFLKNKLYWSQTMIMNVFRTAFRNLKRQKGHFILNLIGLTVGMVSCLLIALYVRHELSYDRFNSRFEDICRVQVDVVFNGIDGNLAQIGGPAGPTLAAEYPEVEAAARIWQPGRYVVQNGDRAFTEEAVGFTDPSFFDVFSIPLEEGDRKTLLQSPESVVISRRMAQKYFPDRSPIGAMLCFDNSAYYQVQGVFADFPDNAHFQFDFLLSFSSLEESRVVHWLSFNYYTYVLLRPHADIEALNAKVESLATRYCGPEFQLYMGQSYDEVMTGGNRLRFYLEPLQRIHLHGDVLADIAPQGDIRYVQLFTLIACFILLIACFNFINLTTARASSRAREVALRKVVGAPRVQVMVQFLTESLVISGLALGAAVLLAIVALPYFNQLSGKQMGAMALGDPVVLGIMGLVLLFTSLGAGLYPAFVLSAFKPASILRDKLHQNQRGRRLRNTLVVFQFALSVVLLISTMVVYLQLQYIQNKKLGFDRNGVLLIHDAYMLGEQCETFKNQCLAMPQVQSISLSSYLPVPSARNSNTVFPEGASAGKPITVDTWSVDDGYLQTMGIDLLQGRNFRPHSAGDSLCVLVNEALVRRFGWDDPVGKTFRSYVSDNPPTLGTFTVIGVTRNFHYLSMRSLIQPLALFNRSSTAYMAIRLNSNEAEAPLAKFRQLWEEMAPGQPFAYSFMGARFSQTYRTDLRVGRLITIAACIAVVIGCLGLLGLAAFMAERKTKEIGVRKVLGASVPGLVLMLSRSFSQWVLMANIIGWPVAWLVMRAWLDGFAYRIALHWWVFVLSGVITLVIATLAVSMQAYKAALSDPVKSLKCE